MKARITIISPVHIGTGETKWQFEYKKNNNKLINYKIEDLLSTVSNDILLDNQFLKSLSTSEKNKSKRKELNDKLLKNIDYRKCQSNYELSFHFHNLRYNIVETQLKTLNKPYIPGSTIKGYIMNAIYYDFIKNHLKEFYRLIEEANDNQKKNMNIETLLRLFVNDNNFISFIHQISHCIICRDIYFDKMILLESKRMNAYKDEKNTTPLNDVECIDINQERIEEFISIDNKKKETIIKNIINHNKNKTKQYMNEFFNYLERDKIIEICHCYFYDIMQEELLLEKQTDFYSKEGLNNIIYKITNEVIHKGFYMRIGGNTNYFFKSISYAIKKDNPTFYEKYFFNLFFSKQRLKRVTPKKMPTTRVIYKDNKNTYYPGVIKIEFIEEN